MVGWLAAARSPVSRPPGVEQSAAVLLCSDLAGDELDLEELKSALSERLPGVSVTVFEQLCERPDAVVAALRSVGTNRAVIGTCRRTIAEAELRARARRNGTSLYDLEIVRVPRTRGAAVAAAVLQAAHARLTQTPDDEPSRAVPTVEGLSRRALLQFLPVVTMQPVATVDPLRCTSFDRCGLCAGVCPAVAIAERHGKAAVGSADCDACGLCIPACPVQAIHLAGASTGAIEAQLETLLETLLEQPGPVGVLFACARSIARLDDDATLDDWAVVELPSLSIVTPGWILQLFAAGVGGVRLSACAGDCCAPWREGGASLDLCRRLLPPALVDRILAGESEAEPPRPAPELAAQVERLVLTEPAATVAALPLLLDANLEFDHPASPLGVVELDDGCTVCGACATACPTGALTRVDDDTSTTLRFEASCCSGCGLCVDVCPENVLHVERRIDTARLVRRAVPIATAPLRYCAQCGEALPPQPVLERNRRLLAETWPLLADSPPDLCFGCVGASAAPNGIQSRLTKGEHLQ